jgi:glycosyltransferase involved in cell wall biosynthesis
MHENLSPSLLVVVPTLNSCDLLPRLVKSLQQQTWHHWRLLFIDGPSSSCHRHWLSQCCSFEPRCSWVEQTPEYPGIFGAMNQGLALAAPEDWLLFWGSDDWAASPNVLAAAISAIESADIKPDLLVCEGRYANASSKSLGRFTRFQPSGLLHASSFRRALWFGSTPPHQATFFGPTSRSKKAYYATGFRLSADLDYFLRVGRHPDLLVMCLDLVLVHMAEGGVSGQQTKLRLHEVRSAYGSAYGWLWCFPFLARYVRRLASLVQVHQ